MSDLPLKPACARKPSVALKDLVKKYSSNTAIDIFGDYVVAFVGVQPGKLEEEPLQFVMKSRRLADGYRKFFQCMWDYCKE